MQAERIREAADKVGEAKSLAAEVLEAWADLPDAVEASSGELERAIELLGRVCSDLDDDADRSGA